MSVQSEVTQIAAAAGTAGQRLSGNIRKTPLLRASWLDGASCKAFLKLENLQYTGSFKVRGALNALVDAVAKGQRVFAASTGNHGLGVAFACRSLGANATIFAPATSSPSKLAAIKALGADVRLVGSDCIEAEEAARAAADEANVPFVSPYNDEGVIAGQGTVAVEILAALPTVDAVFSSVGGGGLIAGVGAVLLAANPNCRIVGCSPSASAVMAASVTAGRVVDLPSSPTLSDGTAGGIEQGTITLPLCAEIVDHFALVSEDAIAAAMRMLISQENVVPEGAAGCALAAYLDERDTLSGNVVVVICGGNVSASTLCEVLGAADATRDGSET